MALQTKLAFRLYIIGLSILFIAIIANGMIIRLGIKSWYDALTLLNEYGLTAFKQLSVLDYLWLFLAYTMVLAFGYWVGDKLYQFIFK